MNYFNDKKNNAIYVIDYAHTEQCFRDTFERHKNTIWKIIFNNFVWLWWES